LGEIDGSDDKMALADLTKEYIATTYKTMAEQLPASQVSITAIAEACDINRKTFYYHFSDIFDLNVWIFRQELAHELRSNLSQKDFVVDTEIPNEKYRNLAFYIDSRKKSSPQDMGAFWSILSAYMHHNRAFYKKTLVYDETNNNNLTKYILRIYYIQIEKDIMSNLASPCLPKNDITFLASYFTNACVGWIINNIKSFLPDYYPANHKVSDIRFSNLTHTLIKLVTRENTLLKMKKFTQCAEYETIISSLIQNNGD
jgi:AcrR family transcriptional regulator